MPTILTHPAVPLAFALGLGRRHLSRRLVWAGVVASILPDLDVVSFAMGIPYAHDCGHRGCTHSLMLALVLALLAAWQSTWLQTTRRRALAFVFLAGASHGLLDAFTNGGLGVALLWPFSHERYFAPMRMIEVSPIGAGPMFTARGLTVLQSELLWVWLPCVLLAVSLYLFRRMRRAD